MGSFSDDLSERFLVFVVNIIKLEKQLCKTYSGRHIYGQLFRAGTSSGISITAKSVVTAKSKIGKNSSQA